MTRAAEVPLERGLTFGTAARRVVAVRVGEVVALLGQDASDPGAVHDLRVALRRLRSALEVFEGALPRDVARPALRDVRRLAEALGERRDADARAALVRELAAGLDPADAPGADLVLARLAEAGEAGAVAARAALEAARADELEVRLHALGAEADA